MKKIDEMIKDEEKGIEEYKEILKDEQKHLRTLKAIKHKEELGKMR